MRYAAPPSSRARCRGSLRSSSPSDHHVDGLLPARDLHHRVEDLAVGGQEEVVRNPAWWPARRTMTGLTARRQARSAKSELGKGIGHLAQGGAGSDMVLEARFRPAPAVWPRRPLTLGRRGRRLPACTRQRPGNCHEAVGESSSIARASRMPSLSMTTKLQAVESAVGLVR